MNTGGWRERQYPRYLSRGTVKVRTRSGTPDTSVSLSIFCNKLPTFPVGLPTQPGLIWIRAKSRGFKSSTDQLAFSALYLDDSLGTPPPSSLSRFHPAFNLRIRKSFPERGNRPKGSNLRACFAEDRDFRPP